MIIFDEKEYAENLIKDGYTNRKYIAQDNIILVKYWKYKGLKESDIKEKLKDFMSEFQDLYIGFNIVGIKVDRAMTVGMKYPLLTNVVVRISQEEINQINKLNDLRLQKMMFVILVIWKFKGQPERLRITNSDICRLSRENLNSNVFWDCINGITRSKMLAMKEYKNKAYYTVNVTEDDSNVVLEIKNFDGLIDYYLSLLEPDKYKVCENEGCGALIKITNNKVKYCNKCAKEIQQKQKNKWKRDRWNGRKIKNR